MAAGRDHSLFVSNRGQVFACGNNQHGQLGLADTPEVYVPTLVRLLKGKQVLDVAASNIHSVFVTNQAIYSCGQSNGQLGHSNQQRGQPVMAPREMTGSAVLASQVVQVDASESMTAVLLDQGIVHMWHRGKDRKLTCPSESTLVGSRATFVQVALGKHESLIGLSSTGAVWVYNGSVLLRAVLRYPRTISATSMAFGVQEQSNYVLLLTDRFSSQTFEAKFTLKQLEKQKSIPIDPVPLLFQSAQVHCDPGAHHFIVAREPHRLRFDTRYNPINPNLVVDTGEVKLPRNTTTLVVQRLWKEVEEAFQEQEDDGNIQDKHRAIIQTDTMVRPTGLPVIGGQMDLRVNTPASLDKDLDTTADALDVTMIHSPVAQSVPGLARSWQEQDGSDSSKHADLEVTLHGIETATFRLFLKYIYTGQLATEVPLRQAVLRVAVLMNVPMRVTSDLLSKRASKRSSSNEAVAALIVAHTLEAIELGYLAEGIDPDAFAENYLVRSSHHSWQPALVRESLEGIGLSHAGADVMLVVSSNKQLACHRAVLSKQSPVFDALFDRTWMAKTDTPATKLRLDLTGEASVRAFCIFVGYLYEGSVDLTQDRIEDLLDVLVLASFYLVEPLALTAASALRHRLHLGNVALLLNYACFYSQAELLMAAAHFACRNLEMLLCSKTLEGLPTEAYEAIRTVLLRHLPARGMAVPAIATPAWLLSERADQYHELTFDKSSESSPPTSPSDNSKRSRLPKAAQEDEASETDYVVLMTSMGFDPVASKRLLNRYGHSELGIRRATEILMKFPSFDAQKPIQAQIVGFESGQVRGDGSPPKTSKKKKKKKGKGSAPPRDNWLPDPDSSMMESETKAASAAVEPESADASFNDELSMSAESRLTSKERRKLRRQQEKAAQQPQLEASVSRSIPSLNIDIAAVKEFVPLGLASTTNVSATALEEPASSSKPKPAAASVPLGVQAVLKQHKEPTPADSPSPMPQFKHRGVVPMATELTDPKLLPKRTLKPVKKMSQRERKAQARREAEEAARAAMLDNESPEPEPTPAPAWGVPKPSPATADRASVFSPKGPSLRDLELEAKHVSRKERSFTARLQSSQSTPPPIFQTGISPGSGPASSWGQPPVSMRSLVADMERAQQAEARAEQRRRAKTVAAIQIEEAALRALNEMYNTHDRSDEWIVIERRFE
eukprot:TRINITY_DN9494_c0_g1_i1.p1 TRINITY_DN9494_c0_g1~~TRINITY_DN9494_c0_g1_i1.p1  ORF type:complete len:1383 (+),score=338.09 TRINITY_DN9494_c0_g1_i1:605-4150(+)